MQLSIIPILYILGAAQGAFLAMALFTTRAGNRRGNRYLGALTLVFVVALLDYASDTSGFTELYPCVRTVFWPKEFLYGPLIYLYVIELTQPSQFVKKRHIFVHFVPAIIHACITWPLLFLEPQRQFSILSDDVQTGTLDSYWAFVLGDIELVLTILQITIYLLIALKIIKHHRQRIKEAFSYTEKISLDWLYRLVIGIFCVYFIWLFEEFFSEPLSMGDHLDTLLGLSMVALIYSMGYLGLRQPRIFSRQDFSVLQTDKQVDTDIIKSKPKQKPNESVTKYKNSSISPELSKALADELDTLMKEKKIYLDSRLSLPKLAELSDMSINNLSQVINEQNSMNFFDYVNSYRIEEAISRIQSPDRDNENLLSIAMDSGFNSKSSFYTAFKKYTGLTPGEYRKKIKQHL